MASTGPVADGEPVTFLVRGVDGVTATGGQGGRSADAAAGPARSGGRHGVGAVGAADLLVREPASGTKVRINELPVDSQVSAVESQLGVPVDHVVEVDFAGFQALVERAGGAGWADAPLRDLRTGLYIDEPGCVALDGEQALALVRSRHMEVLDASGRWVPDPSADLARTSLQRACWSPPWPTSPGGSTPSRPTASPAGPRDHLTLDESLGADELVDLARSVLALDPAVVTEMLLPVVPAAEDNRLDVDPAAGPPVIDAFREGTAPPEQPGPRRRSPPAEVVRGRARALLFLLTAHDRRRANCYISSTALRGRGRNWEPAATSPGERIADRSPSHARRRLHARRPRGHRRRHGRPVRRPGGAGGRDRPGP